MKLKRMIAVLLCASTLCSGCASAEPALTRPALHTTVDQPDTALLASYVKALPIGSRVRVNTTAGDTVTGTLMKADDTGIVVQPRRRLPEAPLQIPVARLARVEIETKTGVAKAVGAGFAAGAAGALAVFLVLVVTIRD